MVFLVTGMPQSIAAPANPDSNRDRNEPSCRAVANRFGRMLGRLSAARWPGDAVDELSTRVIAEEETEPTPEGQRDEEENDDIDAGVTYVGQFIDHDLTLDARRDDLTTPVDPFTLTNTRTPSFDLDSMYGAGPQGSPQLYEADGVHMRLGAPLTGATTDPGAVDLPRNPQTGSALLGDPRNDENRIIASLHQIFLRFHNMLADQLAASHPRATRARIFAETQRLVRLHYQWAVLTDFLPSIVGRDMTRAVLPSMNVSRNAPRLATYDPCTMNMPVEFAVAAYRFGHSIVRPIYRINTAVAARLPVFSLTGDPTRDLGGFRPSPSNFAIDWSFLFHMEGRRRIGRPQASYKIDNSLVFQLGLLPLPDTGAGPASLARRNLLRSMQLGLPSGQDAARALNSRPLRDDQILIGKAVEDPEEGMAITEVSRRFAGSAPLWTYLLAESTANSFNVHHGRIDGDQIAPMRLGRVGGRIVAEVFVGLMWVDRSSVLYNPSFRPIAAFTNDGEFGFRELIRAVTRSLDAHFTPVR
jgi:hypothetical protein